MNRKKRFVSVKRQIIMSTLIPVVCCFAIISLIYFFSLSKSLNDTATADFLRIGQKYALNFESTINEAMNYLTVVASTLEWQVAEGNTSREELQQTIRKIFDDYELIDGSSVYFEPDMYDGKDAEYIGSEYGTKKSGRICWYYYIYNNSTVYLPEGIDNDIEFELPHYTEAKEANRPIYTDPTAHEVNGKTIPMFTLTYPIHDSEGLFIGAVTVDLFLEDLYSQLQSEQIYETGYIMIGNDHKQVIYSPKYEDIGKSWADAGIDYPLPPMGQTEAFFNPPSILNGKYSLMAVESITIPQLDSRFFVSVTAPVDEIGAESMSMMLWLLLSSLMGIIVIALLLYYFISRITAPIKEITESANKMAAGEYHTRINGDYRYEFAIVKDSVNTMADNIEAYIGESKNSLNILKNILNGLDAFIYVTVPDTGEILFINDHMRQHFHLPDDVVGKYCYHVLQEGFTDRCDFCPCHQLDQYPDEVVVWEEHNTVTKRDYRNTDCYIDWLDGVKAHLQHSVDITDIKTFMNDKLEAERQALEMKHKKEKAEAAAQAKNDFLARMSHEIRTPMNAVMGMSEIMLRQELPPDIYENALGIRSASVNLLSIINDILDFSKIESGMMEITETDYLLASLINDVISIIRIRLIDKPVQFAVNIAADIPAALKGDEIRIRQILINLLSNAVKYTNEGHISLTVSGTVNDDTVTLSIDVADSGIGVRKEDMSKLFGDFVQIDTVKNKGVEGTGLGLAISLRLCRLMGGDIALQSEYGKGSTFTITLPQKFTKIEPFATVENLSEKSVLLYETRQIYRDSLTKTLTDLHVDYQSVENIPALFDGLTKYPYVFISSFMYGSIRPALSSLANPPKLVLLSDITETLAPKDASTLIMPAHSLSIANILNDVYEEYGGTAITSASFIAPDARVLIVDDVAANLKVAEGLLLPYEMQTTLCQSGREALELIAANQYDLVFMDHMMPEMDGIEVTRRIREMEGEYFQSLPIVALTANAVSGVREMFVQNGMNDFLAKPIEFAKLDVILEKWLPKGKCRKAKLQEQTEEESDFMRKLWDVPELDVHKVLKALGGSSATYERVVMLSARLLPDNIARLNELIDSSLANYTIEVHGVKGVLNNIGAYRLGLKALELEELSGQGDLDSCKPLHAVFITELTRFTDTMKALMAETEEQNKQQGELSLVRQALPELENAVELYDGILALEILSPMNNLTFNKEVDQTLEELTRAFEYFDFEKAQALIEELKAVGE